MTISMGWTRRSSFNVGFWRPADIFILWTVLILLSSSVSTAQVSASITGLVTDPSGAPVPSATVTVRNLETGAVRRSMTSEEGHIVVLSLPVGLYDVRIAREGFQDATRSGIHLVVG